MTDARRTRWDVHGTAGADVTLNLTWEASAVAVPLAGHSVSVWVGGSVDPDPFNYNAATEYPAVLAGTTATVTVTVPTGGSVPLRVTFDRTLDRLGTLTPSTVGTTTATLDVTFDTRSMIYRPLGTATVTGTGTPPANGVYNETPIYTVAATGIANLTATCAVKEPVGTDRGTVILFSIGAGEGWWTDNAVDLETWIATDLAADGYRTIQVKWASPGWFGVPSLQVSGPAVLGVRPATLAWQLFKDYCEGTGGQFILSGHSGGATACAVSMGFYGLGSVVDRVGFTAGPPFSSMDLVAYPIGGTYDDGTHTPWPFYDLGAAQKIDESYGDFTGTGPCASHSTDAVWVARWQADGMEAGISLSWPDTAAYMQHGLSDTTSAVAQGLTFAEAMDGAGQPYQLEWVDQTHNQTLVGATALGAFIRDDTTGVVQAGIAVFGDEASPVTVDMAAPGRLAAVTAGSTVVLAVRANCAHADVPTPIGWTRDAAVNGPASAFCLVVLSKVVTATETVTITSGGDRPRITVEMVEAVAGFDVADRTSTYSGTIVTARDTIPIPTTAATTAASELAFTFIASGDPTATRRTVTRWTDGFSPLTCPTYIATAYRRLFATETLASTPVSTVDALTVAAAVVTYK